MKEQGPHGITPIDGEYHFHITNRGEGTGDLRLTEYFQGMLGLSELFAQSDVAKSPARQLEVVTSAVGLTRDFLMMAVPGAGIEAPLGHLMTALIATGEGHRVPMFSIAEVKRGRDFARVLFESKVASAIDLLHDKPLRMPVDEAAQFIARMLEKHGVQFSGAQILEWRRRFRKGGVEGEDWYFQSIAAGRKAKAAHTGPQAFDVRAAVTGALSNLLVTAISPAHINKPE